MLKFLVAFILHFILLFHVATAQNSHFVSPVGLANNVGTIENPWSLRYALNGAQQDGKLNAGDTIYLLKGEYIGLYTSTIGFVSGKPILVMNYQNKRAIINGNTGINKDSTALTIYGKNTWYMGLEITSTYKPRIESGVLGVANVGVEKIVVCSGLDVYGTDIKIINCVIHDMPGAGLSSWKYADNNEVYGCIIYHNGYFSEADTANANSLERSHGPGMYLQHLNSSKPLSICNNFVFRNFWSGIQAKTKTPSPGHALNGINIDSNTIFNAGALNYGNIARKYNLIIGSDVLAANPAENIYVRANTIYNDETNGVAPYINLADGEWKPFWYKQFNISFGLQQKDSSIFFHNNYVTGSSYYGNVYVRNYFAKLDFQKNTFYDPIGRGTLVGVDYFSNYEPNDSVRLKGIWNYNYYYSTSAQPFSRIASSGSIGQHLSLSNFREVMKVDANSTQQTVMPPADTAFVRPDKYTPNRYYVTVLNYSGVPVYNLPFSKNKLIGKQYIVTDIQNLYASQVASGVYNGHGIALPMALVDVSAPLGNVPLLPQHTTTALGTFILQFSDTVSIMSCNPPYNVSISNTVNTQSLLISWNAASQAAKYIIEKRNGNNWDSIGYTTDTFFVANNLEQYNNTYFRVGARCIYSEQIRYSSSAKSAGKYFVAPTGAANADGSINNPWSLTYALSEANGILIAGDSVLLKGGKYNGNFTASLLSGTVGKPIVFKNFGQEKAIIDGYTGNNSLAGLSIGTTCHYLQFIGLEVTSSAPSKLSSVAGDIYTGNGVEISGHNIKLINCIIHDVPGDGVWLDKSAVETEIYGCIIYYNGFERSLQAFGSGIRVQNNSAQSKKQIINNIIIKSGLQGINMYGGASSETITGICIDSTTVYNTGALLTNSLGRKYNLLVSGGSSLYPAKNVFITKSVFIRDETDGSGTTKPYNLRYNISLGQVGVTNNEILFGNNYIVGGGYYGAVFLQSNYKSFDVQNNYFYTPDKRNKLLFVNAGVSIPPIWNSNKYYSENAAAFSGSNWESWKTTYSVDVASVYKIATPADTFIIRKNKYDPTSYYITVINNSNSSSVKLPVHAPYFAGGSYTVIDAQNYSGGAIATGSYNGSYIDLALNSTAVAAPVGTVATQPVHSSVSIALLVVKLADAPVYCAGGSTSFVSNLQGANYQWQVNKGSGFVNITGDATYSGTESATLQLFNLFYGLNNYQYRCVVDNKYSNVFRLKVFATIWKGTINNDWENAANWHCGVAPGINSTVIINGGNVVLKNNAGCKSIKMNNNAKLTLMPGVKLTVMSNNAQ